MMCYDQAKCFRFPGAGRTQSRHHQNIGWYTFRHSFRTLLKANGEDVKTVQELLRHANSRITLDVYTQAVNSNKRAAQSEVIRMIIPGAGTISTPVGTTESGGMQSTHGRRFIVPIWCPDFVVT